MGVPAEDCGLVVVGLLIVAARKETTHEQEDIKNIKACRSV